MQRTLKVGSCLAAVVAGMSTLSLSLYAGDFGDIVISEFQTNNSTLADENGAFGDWVEFYNAGSTDVNMDGWHLTDDLTDTTKWPFPAVTIPAGGFLIVFASDKDRRDPSRELHLNFKLSSLGEDLALYDPDGSIAWGYLPYPAQPEGFSYGLEMNASRVPLVAGETPARALVPTNGNLGTTWTSPTFNDSGWMNGTTGIGYDRNSDYDPLINLDVRSQMENLSTTCYIRIPFSVDNPAGFGGFILRMKYDDGFVAYLNGTRIESSNAPTSLSWDSAATGLHDDSAAQVFEEFNASAPGVLRDGTNVLAVHGLNDNLGSSDFVIFPELEGLDSGELNRKSELFFPTATPGSGNLPGFTDVLAAPSFFPAGRVFTGSINVTLEVSDPSADIFYTTDGSDPTQSDIRYTGPISLSSSTLIRARAFESTSASSIRSEGYIALASNVQSANSNLPLILLENFGGGSIPQDPFRPAYMAIIEPTNGRAAITDAPVLQTRIGIKVRGSSTSGRPKKSYRFEAWDERDQDKSIEPLGMPREADWILYGAYNFDRAHIRNPFIYRLSNLIGRYAVRTVFCEAYFNTGGGRLSSSDYIGIYSFCESIKRDANRVDVERLVPANDSPPEIAGGYMMKIDRADPGDRGFGAAGQTIRYVYPKEEEITVAQETWLRNYINAMGSSLGTSNYVNYVDVDSWIDHHILNVLPKNVDALRLSTYFYKSRFGRIEFGPIWDFDRSMDSTDGRDNSPTTWNGTGDGTKYFDYPWWDTLFNHADFWQAWKDRWHLFRQQEMSEASIRFIIDDMASQIREAVPRDIARWGQISSTTAWQNEINHVKNWLATRANWIDSQFLAPPRLSSPTRQVSPGFVFGITGSGGTIYYTLDGTDPRSPGGGLTPGATQYSGNITVNENTRVVARVRASSLNWSAPAKATYYIDVPSLVITELMYHPPGILQTNGFNDEDFEFAECFNIGDQPLDLTGIRFVDGIRFTFPPMILQPQEYVVIVNDLEAFESRYDTSGMSIAGEYEGNLENAGEVVQLVGPLEEPMLLFAYRDTWYPETDGGDASLVIVDPWAAPSSWGNKDSWAPSTVIGGSPGDDDEGFSTSGGRQRIGDSNQDGRVNIADAVSFLRRLFGGSGAALPCEGESMTDGSNLALFNVNGDINVDVSDVVYVLNYLFANGPSPAGGTRCVRLEGCPTVCTF